MKIIYVVMQDFSDWGPSSSKEDERFGSYEEAENHIKKRFENSADLMSDLNLWIKKLYSSKELESSSYDDSND